MPPPSPIEALPAREMGFAGAVKIRAQVACPPGEGELSGALKFGAFFQNAQHRSLLLGCSLTPPVAPTQYVVASCVSIRRDSRFN
jgi:hypothetical protein